MLKLSLNFTYFFILNNIDSTQNKIATLITIEIEISCISM